jgi:hypothetical protein
MHRTLKDYITEVRREDADYKENKAKGIIDKVILELGGSEAGNATKLAKRFKRLQVSIKRMEKAEGELKEKLRGLVEGSFDESKDIFYTRVLATSAFTITLAKQQEAKSKAEVNYDKVFEGLEQLIDVELQKKVLDLIEANTRRWTPDAPKSSVLVKQVEEGVIDAAKGALSMLMQKITDYSAKLKTKFAAWGKAYDGKLDELRDEAKGKPMIKPEEVAEAKVPGKFAKFVAT